MSKQSKILFWTQSSFNNSLEKVEKEINNNKDKSVKGKAQKRKVIEIPKKNSETWIKRFEPEKLEDLAVHNKKIDQIKNFFKHCDNVKTKGCNKIALLTGPPGVGKTATLNVVAKISNYEVLEWITPVDINENYKSEEFYLYKESQLSLFKHFVFQSSRYGTLFENCRKKLLLIEDFPNFIIRNPQLLEEILEHYKIYGNFPIVFITTDSRSREMNLSLNLFPDSIKDKFDIMQINFNPVAISLIKKGLKRILSQISKEACDDEIYNIPNQEILNSICLTANGDIRNAVANLHFSMLNSSKHFTFNSIKTKKTLAKETKRSSVGRNEAITFMHALGRVFHPKYREGERKFLHSPEEITDHFITEDKNFINFVFANYLSHFIDIENVLEAVNSLSFSDNLQLEYQTNNSTILGLNLAIRGVMVSNQSPKGGMILIKAPRKKDNWVLTSEKLGKFTPSNVSKKIIATDMKSYINIIAGHCNLST